MAMRVKDSIKKINIFIILSLMICLSQNNLLTFGYYNWYDDQVANAYKDGKPDHADGDLKTNLVTVDIIMTYFQKREMESQMIMRKEL